MKRYGFRAWDGDEGVMYYSDGYSTHGEYLTMAEFWRMFEKYDFLVEQFSTLHDDNNKEMYAGDIIRSYSYRSDGSCTKRDWIIGFDVYDDSDIDYGSPGIGFYAYELDKEVYPEEHGLTNFTGSLEVIGNIHETPEFLSLGKNGLRMIPVRSQGPDETD